MTQTEANVIAAMTTAYERGLGEAIEALAHAADLARAAEHRNVLREMLYSLWAAKRRLANGEAVGDLGGTLADDFAARMAGRVPVDAPCPMRP